MFALLDGVRLLLEGGGALLVPTAVVVVAVRRTYLSQSRNYLRYAAATLGAGMVLNVNVFLVLGGFGHLAVFAAVLCLAAWLFLRVVTSRRRLVQLGDSVFYHSGRY